MNNLVNSSTVSMSLREIAKVLNLSQPSNIVKSADKLVENGVINYCTSSVSIKLDQRLNRIDSITLVAQNNPAFTKAIVQRLDELESVTAKVENIKDDRILSLQLSREALKTAHSFGFKGNQALLSADKATKALTGYSPLTLMGHTQLLAEDNDQIFTPTELGKLIEPNVSAVKLNKILKSKGLQHKLENKWISTDLGDSFCTKLDTGKKHSDGTPIQQLKWKKSVIDIIQ